MCVMHPVLKDDVRIIETINGLCDYIREKYDTKALFNMDSIVYKWEEEIRDRFRKQSIDIENCIIMFPMNDIYFNGERISGYSFSKDGRWICVPILNEEETDFYEEYIYATIL